MTSGDFTIASTCGEMDDFLRRIDSGGKILRHFPYQGGRFAVCSPFCDDACERELREHCLRPPPDLTIYKNGSRSVVGARSLATGETAVLKYYFPKHFHKRLSYGIRGSRSGKSWRAALGFLKAGLPTPAPLLHAEWRSVGGLCWNRSFLATGKAEGIVLKKWVEGKDAASLAAMAETLRELFERMRRFRIHHGDLKATNILVDDGGHISFVDLDAAVIAAPPRSWPALRERDRRIFEGNWRHADEEIRRAFSGLFNDSLSS